jgi:hypothetical protein
MTQARAADAVKQTPFSINEPFEIPSMMLEPGQYVFQLVEREPQRNVLDVFETVQLWTSDQTRLLSTLLTMPNYDQPTTDKTVFTFFERGAKQPKALRIWFAPGRNYGQEFVYPKIQAVELGKSVGRAVLSMPPELPGDLGKLAAAPAPPAPQPIQKRAATPKAVSTASVPVPVQSRARVSEPKIIAANLPQATALPKTASYLVLFAVLGVLGIIAGSSLRVLELRLERR